MLEFELLGLEADTEEVMEAAEDMEAEDIPLLTLSDSASPTGGNGLPPAGESKSLALRGKRTSWQL